MYLAHIFDESLLHLVIALFEGVGYACVGPKRKELCYMEMKGITCKIPLELHNRISDEIRETESTMGKFIEMIINEHYTKEENSMSRLHI